MKTRSIVSAIVAAALSVVLCVGLLVGTTVAWFTDTVSSTGNSITAGALAVELNDGSSEALFTSDTVWAPGTSQRRSVRVENVGSVALRYSIAARNIVTSGDADLSKVLNVYKTATGAEVTEGTLLGTLATSQATPTAMTARSPSALPKPSTSSSKCPVPSATSIRTAASPSTCA